MRPDWFHDLAAHNALANLRLSGACAKLTHAELIAPRTSFFPTILGTLAHIAIVDLYSISPSTCPPDPPPSPRREEIP